jgi:hypothetical protein
MLDRQSNKRLNNKGQRHNVPVYCLKNDETIQIEKRKKNYKKSNKSFLAVNCDVAETAGKRLWFSDADEKIFFKSEKFQSVSTFHILI